MPHVFLSYTHADRELAAQLAAALQARELSVWWDQRLSAGDVWDNVIEKALADAGCVVVLWSMQSVGRRWVRAEAGDGERRGILVPVVLDTVEPPLAFRHVQYASLGGWQGDVEDPRLDALAAAIRGVLAKPRDPADTPVSTTARDDRPGSEAKRRWSISVLRRGRAWSVSVVVAFVAIAIGATYAVLRDPRPPVAQCLEVALAKARRANPAIDLGIVTRLAQSERIDLTSKNEQAVEYRQLADETVRSAIEVCRAVYERQAPVPKDEAELAAARRLPAMIVAAPLITVFRKVADRTVRAEAGLTISGGEGVDSCQTRDDGSCRVRLSQVRADQELVIRLTTKDGTVVEEKRRALELARDGLTLTAPAAYELVTIIVERCGTGDLLNNAELTIDAPGAVLWSKDKCGSVPPVETQACRSAKPERSTTAFYYAPATLEKAKLVVRPSTGRPATYSLDTPFSDQVNVTYPATCPDGSMHHLCGEPTPRWLQNEAAHAAAGQPGRVSVRVDEGRVVKVTGPPEVTKQLNSRAAPERGPCSYHFDL